MLFITFFRLYACNFTPTFTHNILAGRRAAFKQHKQGETREQESPRGAQATRWQTAMVGHLSPTQQAMVEELPAGCTAAGRPRRKAPVEELRQCSGRCIRGAPPTPTSVELRQRHRRESHSTRALSARLFETLSKPVIVNYVQLIAMFCVLCYLCSGLCLSCSVGFAHSINVEARRARWHRLTL